MFDAPTQQHQRRIEIAVTACPTGAGMPAFTQPLRVDLPALMTALRGLECACGCLSIDHSSFCRFIAKHAEELRGLGLGRLVMLATAKRSVKTAPLAAISFADS